MHWLFEFRSYEDALAAIKEIDRLQNKNKSPDGSDTKFGKTVKQIEKEQERIRKMQESDSFATVQRGNARARKFEDKYGISVSDDARNYRGRSRKDGSLNNKVSYSEEHGISENAYSQAMSGGAMFPESINSTRGANISPTSRPAAVRERAVSSDSSPTAFGQSRNVVSPGEPPAAFGQNHDVVSPGTPPASSKLLSQNRNRDDETSKSSKPSMSSALSRAGVQQAAPVAASNGADTRRIVSMLRDILNVLKQQQASV